MVAVPSMYDCVKQLTTTCGGVCAGKTEADMTNQQQPMRPELGGEHLGDQYLGGNASVGNVVDTNQQAAPGLPNHPNVTAPEVVVRVDTGRFRRARALALTGVAFVGLSAYALHRFDDLVDGLPFGFGSPFKAVPDLITPDLSSQPPVVEAGVDQKSYELQGTFDLRCEARIGAEIPVTGHQDGVLHAVFGLTNANFDKVFYADALLCSDQTGGGNITLTRKGKDITSIDVIVPALEIVQARIDEADVRNQVDINADDSPEERDRKITEFLKDGSNADETAGYECPSFCNTDTVQLTSAARIAAQFAMTIDGRGAELYSSLMAGYQNQVAQELADRYGIPLELVSVQVDYGNDIDPTTPLTPDQIRQLYDQRIKDAYAATLAENGLNQAAAFEVAPELRTDEKGLNQVYLKLTTGAEATINLGSLEYQPEQAITSIDTIHMDIRDDRAAMDALDKFSSLGGN